MDICPEVGIVTKKCNFVIRYCVTQKSNFVIRYSVTPLQKVTEVTVTPWLRYFYKIESQKRRKEIDDAAATN